MRWKPPPARPGEVNYDLFDRFTFAHLAVGAGYGLFGFGFWTAFLLATTWEVVENPLKANVAFLFPHASADTLHNSLGDIIAVIAGWFIVRYLFAA